MQTYHLALLSRAKIQTVEASSKYKEKGLVAKMKTKSAPALIIYLLQVYDRVAHLHAKKTAPAPVRGPQIEMYILQIYNEYIHSPRLSASRATRGDGKMNVVKH